VDPVTIDCHYTGRPGVAAAYLLRDGEEAAFVETNTTPAVPRLLAALADTGLAPEQVRYIIITHIHLDHAGGAGALMAACPHATLLAHPKAAPHAIDPARIIAGAAEVYGEAQFAALYGRVHPVPAERVRALEDHDTVALGDRTLSFLHTRGHANHHFCIYDARTAGVFTGDSFGIAYPALQRHGPVIFPSTTPTDFDAAAAHDTVDRIVATGAQRLYLTHFGTVEDPASLAPQLHDWLAAHAAIEEEGDTSGREGEQLSTFCKTRVAALFDEHLRAAGLHDDPDALALVAFDVALNAQGLDFAVRKRRYKRSRPR